MIDYDTTLHGRPKKEKLATLGYHNTSSNEPKPHSIATY